MKARNDRTVAETADPKAEDRIPKVNRRDFVALSVGTGITAGFALATRPGVAQTTNERKLPMAYSNKHIATPFGDIAYTEQGKGPAALFVHGVFKNAYFWRHVIERVSDLRRCIAVDLMAHGATRIAPDQDVSFTVQAEMLEAFCDRLNLDQVDLVANDSGAGIAQIFAARHPGRIRTLTITDSDTHDNWPPPAFMPAVELARQGKLGEGGKRLLADPNAARAAYTRSYEHPENISDETLRIYLEPIFGTPEATRNVERFVAGQDSKHTVPIAPLLRRLEAPALVVWGTNDVFFPVKWAYWLRGTLPNCRPVVELEGAKLWFPEERPEELEKPLREHWGA
jgi:pimeloyl-ACP methyl ester carboxylesterase